MRNRMLSRFVCFGAACGLVTLFYVAPGSRPLWAHQDPVACTTPLATVRLAMFFADMATPIPTNQNVTECEKIFFRAVLERQHESTCAFGGGVLRIKLPNKQVVTVASGDDIPCVGGTDPAFGCGPAGVEIFRSVMVEYRVNPDDQVLVGDELRLVARALYGDLETMTGGGTVHAGNSDLENAAFAETAIPVGVAVCESGNECIDSFCDENVVTEQPSGGVRVGQCVESIIAGRICVGPGEIAGECDENGDCVIPSVPGHFKCYKSRSARFAKRSVQLADQFATTTAAVLRPFHFCNPADKNGEEILNPIAHLNCYKIRERRLSRRIVRMTNQFGQQTLAVRRAETLCVPAVKDDIGTLNNLNLNHFKCYRVKATVGRGRFEERTVQVDDQFEEKDTVVIKPHLICNPVDKNGEGVPDPEFHMTCFKIMDAAGQAPFVPVQPSVTDQFVEQDLGTARRTDCKRARMLCVPSSKEEL